MKRLKRAKVTSAIELDHFNYLSRGVSGCQPAISRAPVIWSSVGQWQAADISSAGSSDILQILQLWSCDSLSKIAFALLVVSHGSHSPFTPPSYPLKVTFRVYFCIILSKWKLTLFVALSFTHGTHKVNFNGSGANSICLLLYFPFFEFCTIFWRNISSNYLRLCTNLLIIWLFHQINKEGEMEIIQLLSLASTKID